jgi:hypothetical protein
MCWLKDGGHVKKWMMGEKFKDEKKWSNHQKQFAFVVGSCARFQNFGVHSNMSVDSAIEKLQIITKEKKT